MFSIQKNHITASISLATLIMLGGSFWLLYPFVTHEDTIKQGVANAVRENNEVKKRVVVHLDTMTIDLIHGTTTITLALLSQGKPGSYYETIGGIYTSDYKTPLHFSSIGHVYMPYSVHLFGNYFIHGVPYYPNGDQVSSAYSGGCIRLTNENAKTVYDFIDEGTPMIVTRGAATDFDNTLPASTTMQSIIMTNLMIATISLETLTQDNVIVGTDSVTQTTRKAELTRLVNNGDSSVAKLYAKDIGDDAFLLLMNQKAAALGLSNTHFTNLQTPVDTTFEDYSRFMTYITTYKSFLSRMLSR